MKLDTPFERLQDLVSLLELDPSVEQVAAHLSKHIDPLGEVTGIAWTVLQLDGKVNYETFQGFHVNMDPYLPLSLEDDNPIGKVMRTGVTQMMSIKHVKERFRDLNNRDFLDAYETALVMSLNDKTTIACALASEFEVLEPYKEYFECIRLVLALWLNKVRFEATELSQKSEYLNVALTPRQEQILTMIKEGATNAAIGLLLGFSESLIRQESIIIYRKLGVDGRRELVGNDHNQTFTLRGED